jgi:hypothetical protein
MIRQRACAPVDILCRRDRAVVTTFGRAGIRPAARPRRHFSDTSPVLRLLFAQTVSCRHRPSAGRHRERPDPPEHRPEQASGQVAFRQQQPVVAGVLDQPSAGLNQALLQAGQRPALDAPWQHQSPPRVRPQSSRWDSRDTPIERFNNVTLSEKAGDRWLLRDRGRLSQVRL